MLFSKKKKHIPQKTFTYNQFSTAIKELRRKTISEKLSYFDNSILQITSLDVQGLKLEIEEFVRTLNQNYIAESKYTSRATYKYINNAEQQIIVIESKESNNIEKLMTLYIKEEILIKFHYSEFDDLLKTYYGKSIFLGDFFKNLNRKAIEVTESQANRLQLTINDEIMKHNNQSLSYEELDQIFEYTYEKDDNKINYQIFLMNKVISKFTFIIK